MSNYSIKDITNSKERYKLYTLMCSPDELLNSIEFIKSEKINAVNIGKELANYINSLEDYRYLAIDVYDFTNKLLQKNKSKINKAGNDLLAIYNLGILLEPTIELNFVQLLKEFSKSTSLIILWENPSDNPDRLDWPTQNQKFFLDFSDIQLKKMQYAI